MTPRLILNCSCFAVLVATANCALAAEPARQVDFARDIRPLFARHCASCHGEDAQESHYRLDDRAIALRGGDLGERPIVPGRSAESPLVRYIAGTDANLKMPPKGARMTAEEVALVSTWIDQGATWPENLPTDKRVPLTTNHWSFQPVKRLSPPGLNDPALMAAARTPVDLFLLDKLQPLQLSFSPPADKVTLLRRLYLDVLGHPPTPAEIDAFAQDDAPDAWERWADRCLTNPRYGERWALHWLDVVRFAETDGFETNIERPNAWRYRDYVIRAFNQDLPYDRFVQQQLAGDTTGADEGTGFLVAGPWDRVKSPDPVLTAMQRSDELADMTNTSATAFLGLTIGCARCHNHKFDPILQTDYYSFQAVFAGVQHGERAIGRSLTHGEQAELAAAQQRQAEIERTLAQFQPIARTGKLLWLDDEGPSPTADQPRGVRVLLEKAGHGEDPAGTERGQKNDSGSVDRLPNVVGRGRYTWWKNQPGKDAFVYHPAVKGNHRVWLSWGSGFGTHTTDAVYLLDRDGDLNTRDDQTPLFTANQQRFADDAQATADKPHPQQPRWSGFVSAGIVDLTETTAIVLRGGSRGEALTADVIAFEETAANESEETAPAQPPLRPAVNSQENTERFPPTKARFVRFTITKTNNNSEPCVDELEIYAASEDGTKEVNVARLPGVKLTSSGDYPGNPIHQLPHVNDGLVGNSHSWISNTAGKGWVQLELPEAVAIERIVWGRDRQGKYQDRTAVEYRMEVAVAVDAWTVVASSVDRLPFGGPVAATTFAGLSAADARRAAPLREELQRLAARQQALSATTLAYAGKFTSSPPPTHRLFRGDPMQPREAVSPNCLSALGDLGLSEQAAEKDRRLALARWMTDPAHPLTARVMANRVWQHHFGTGIVDTPSDFGANGGKPTHPELLDWLASELIDGGWSLKRLHRGLLASTAYRQTSRPHAAGQAADAQARLLWRYPSRRLEAEAIRDSLLVVSGAIDWRAGGPGWSPFRPNTNYVRVYDPKDEFAPADWRRGVYVFKVRMRQDGVFGLFDCPDGGQIAPKRARSTTAVQALGLFNSPFVLQQAQLWAERLAREAGAEPQEQIHAAFRHAFGRLPAEEEVAAARTLVAEHGLEALCRALANANELLFIP